MGKIEHRRKLRERRAEKQKTIQETSGKLIEENHNGFDYTPGYVRKVIAWRFFELWMKTKKYQETPDKLWDWFGKLREGLQTLLLHWPEDKLERGSEFWLIYDLLGYYREGDKKKLISRLQDTFGKIQA